MKTPEEKQAEERLKSFQKREPKKVVIPEQDKKEWDRVKRSITNAQRTRRVK